MTGGRTPLPVAFVSSAEDDRPILPGLFGLFGLPEPWASSRVLPLRVFAAARSVECDGLLLAGVPRPGADAYGVGDADPAHGHRGLSPREGGRWLDDAAQLLEAAGIGLDEPGVVADESSTAVVEALTRALGERRAWDRFRAAV
ncbi:hypothetical protein ACIGBH_24910 [Streptomyces sp. NPDC085929]|uniref:hypothetical protein n=1 Tax=Streptomyces sp. NPDC085929 TaxID=3365739 RepID=UPI0037CCCB84